ncbi:histidine kinase [Streptomyces sp. RY43-2]|uniref:histidine kinase n=1 Tax=Streptomyces macrolidinus TaxID=2952607 RepID=A0ABT0ZBE5_9ACTN|nr:histidine kinase [Streptomyces macrolidinus]MCN9241102.1 histidine kinase [Streptomyces macrolidinus]
MLSLEGLAVFGAASLVVGALLLVPLGAGLWLLPPAAAVLRRTSDRCRTRLTRWTGAPVGPPEPLPRVSSGRTGSVGRACRRSAAVLGDDGFGRDLRWALLEPVTGALLVTLPLVLVVHGVFGALVQPFLWRRLGDDYWFAFVPVRSTRTMLVALALALVFLAAGVRFAPVALRLHARQARRLLAVPPTVELSRRVARLTETRAEAMDVHAAELHRIERDLHDGAQARLVALGMTLDRATLLLSSEPDAARALLLDVREASERALQDLRELVRGIRPPILADRGLGDALRSLALDSLLDVRVDVRLPARLPAPVESAAYFAVAELLANAGKHAGADEIRVTAAHDGARLRVTVADDGKGGADPAGGTGLLGVQRRLGTFDGTVAVHSPPGGPTIVTLEIPCASSSPKTSSS